MDAKNEIKYILDMLDARITNEYTVSAYEDKLILRSRKTDHLFAVRVEEFVS